MINEITLVGNLGSDAEQRNFNGKAVVKFSLATSESRQVNGAWETATEWHKVTGWNHAYLMPKLKKGKKVYVKGKLKSSEYNGAKYWEVSAVVIKLLERDESYQSPQELLPPDPPRGGWG